MHRGLRRRLTDHAPLLLAVAIVLWRLRAFLPPHTLPARGDPSLPFQGSDLTPQWAPWLRIAIDTLWHQQSFVFWNPFINAGAPEFEVPEAGVVSLATLLGGVLPLEAAIKWAMLAHVAVGMAGSYALAKRLRIDTVFAAVGAFMFGLGTYLLDHFRVGHLSHILPMCLMPWVMLFVWNALTNTGSWWRQAAAAGVVLGLEVLEGGTSVFVYTTLALATLVATCIGPEWRRWTIQLVRVGAVMGVAFTAIAAFQLLPMLAYVGLTGRADGLSLDRSLAIVPEVRHPLPTIGAAVLMAAGLLGLVRTGERRIAVWIASMMAISVAAAYVEPFYALLWRNFPGIRYQRIPQRALVIVGVAGPLLIAAGTQGIWTAIERWGRWMKVVAALALVVFVRDAWLMAPSTPPMADPRVEREQNHAMQWLKEHAGGARVHVWESPNRQWGGDHMTVPLGLEAITSYTPSEHRDYLPGDFDRPEDRTFLSESYLHPARFWGMLNVRYVVSSTPRTDDGFTLAARVAACPVQICQPAKSAGTYIYENQKWLPRAWVVSHAIGIVGPARASFDATLDVMRMPEFDPARVAVFQFEPGADPPELDRVLVMDPKAPPRARWTHDRARDAVALAAARSADAIIPAPYRRRNNNRFEIHAPADGWLVLSEKLALYPGWSATVSGARAPIYRANGVLSAIRVRAGQVVRTAYEPKQFRLGVALLVAGVLAAFIADRRSRRPRAAKIDPVPTARPADARDIAATA